MPADVVPAQAGPARAELVQAWDAEAGPAKAQAVSAGAATEEAAPAGTAESGMAESGTAESELTAAELAGTGLAEKGPAERELAEKGPAEAGGLGLADGEENRAGYPQGAAEPQEASRDVGPLAVVGIIVGVVALVGVAAGVLAMVTHGFKPKTVITYRPAAVFGLRPGQCVNAGSNSLSFTVVSCASPHDAEVFARFSLPAAAWPGSAAVRQEAGDGCASRLSGYLNPQLASIGLTQDYVYPNHAAWEASQRTVVCEVSSGNGRLTGSVRAKT
ncbi:MAG TPA: septum formation family protein [Streptosporangiaceae bacterium]|nr:septum formation family protein [Streptosporangiaceae bacterium]